MTSVRVKRRLYTELGDSHRSVSQNKGFKGKIHAICESTRHRPRGVQEQLEFSDTEENRDDVSLHDEHLIEHLEAIGEQHFKGLLFSEFIDQQGCIVTDPEIATVGNLSNAANSILM